MMRKLIVAIFALALTSVEIKLNNAVAEIRKLIAAKTSLR